MTEDYDLPRFFFFSVFFFYIKVGIKCIILNELIRLQR